MRRIDKMSSDEIETFRLTGMLSERIILTREERLAATLIGIKRSLEKQGGFENTIAQIDEVLKP